MKLLEMWRVGAGGEKERYVTSKLVFLAPASSFYSLFLPLQLLSSRIRHADALSCWNVRVHQWFGFCVVFRFMQVGHVFRPAPTDHCE